MERTTDMTPLLQSIDQQLADTEQEARMLQLELARLRGLREGIIKTIEYINQATQPVVTTSDDAGG